MLRTIILLVIIALSSVTAQNFYGTPVKFISGFFSDLDKDNKDELTFVVEKDSIKQLIILSLSQKKILFEYEFKPDMILSSHYKIFFFTNSEGKKNKIEGPFLKLTQPEGSSIVIYFRDGKYKYDWLHD